MISRKARPGSLREEMAQFLAGASSSPSKCVPNMGHRLRERLKALDHERRAIMDLLILPAKSAAIGSGLWRRIRAQVKAEDQVDLDVERPRRGRDPQG